MVAIGCIYCLKSWELLRNDSGSLGCVVTSKQCRRSGTGDQNIEITHISVSGLYFSKLLSGFKLYDDSLCDFYNSKYLILWWIIGKIWRIKKDVVKQNKIKSPQPLDSRFKSTGSRSIPRFVIPVQTGTYTTKKIGHHLWTIPK